MSAATRRRIEISSDRCTGCLLCQLACSHIKAATFSPGRSFISITRVGRREQYSVEFTPQCDGCGFCVSYCCFGALQRSASVASAKRGASGNGESQWK